MPPDRRAKIVCTVGPASSPPRLLARRYGFTEEERGFIPSTALRTGINCDIKYRWGREGEGEEE